MLGALSATAALLPACSSSPGPLGTGGTPGQTCMPWRQGQPVTVGLYDLDNSDTSPVTVKSITLPSAHGLTMTKAWLVPIYHDPKNGNYVVLGVGAAYPPTTAPEWRHREPAVGAVIHPHQDLNIVFGLIRTSARNGRSDGPATTYTAGGSTWTVKEQVSLVVAARSC
jgi:hypothetical protein